MDQKKLAKDLKIPRTYLNGILRGKRVPSRKLAKKIAEATGRTWLDFRPNDKNLLKDMLS